MDDNIKLIDYGGVYTPAQLTDVGLTSNDKDGRLILPILVALAKSLMKTSPLTIIVLQPI